MSENFTAWILEESDPEFKRWVVRYFSKKGAPYTSAHYFCDPIDFVHFAISLNPPNQPTSEQIKIIKLLERAWRKKKNRAASTDSSQICLTISNDSQEKLRRLSRNKPLGWILDKIIYDYYALSTEKNPIEKLVIKELRSQIAVLRKTERDMHSSNLIERNNSALILAQKVKEIDFLQAKITELQAAIDALRMGSIVVQEDRSGESDKDSTETVLGTQVTLGDNLNQKCAVEYYPEQANGFSTSDNLSAVISFDSINTDTEHNPDKDSNIAAATKKPSPTGAYRATIMTTPSRKTTKPIDIDKHRRKMPGPDSQ